MKRAVQRVVRGEDGRIRSIYIDLETFQEVTNLEGYQVITGNTISNPEPVPSVEEPNTEPTGEIPEEPGYSSRGDRESNQYSNLNANVTSPSSARPSSNQGAPVCPVLCHHLTLVAEQQVSRPLLLEVFLHQAQSVSSHLRGVVVHLS